MYDLPRRDEGSCDREMRRMNRTRRSPGAWAVTSLFSP